MLSVVLAKNSSHSSFLQDKNFFHVVVTGCCSGHNSEFKMRGKEGVRGNEGGGEQNIPLKFSQGLVFSEHFVIQ